MGELVRLADDEILEGEARIERRADVALLVGRRLGARGGSLTARRRAGSGVAATLRRAPATKISTADDRRCSRRSTARGCGRRNAPPPSRAESASARRCLARPSSMPWRAHIAQPAAIRRVAKFVSAAGPLPAPIGTGLRPLAPMSSAIPSLPQRNTLNEHSGNGRADHHSAETEPLPSHTVFTHQDRQLTENPQAIRIRRPITLWFENLPLNSHRARRIFLLTRRTTIADNITEGNSDKATTLKRI